MGEQLGKRLGQRHVRHTGPEAYELASRAMKTYETKGFEWMDRGDFDVNLFSLRNSTLRNHLKRKEYGRGRYTRQGWEPRGNQNYDDIMYAIYREDGEWVADEFSVTTEPTNLRRQTTWKNQNRAGVAILKNGQYKAHVTLKHASFNTSRSSDSLARRKQR